jgi:hypothetical protein
MSTQFTGQPTRPGKVCPVNSGSSCRVDYSSRDVDNALEAPSALRYRIDNLTDSRVVLDWTTVETPATEGSVTIPASLNAMTEQFRDRQLNQVTFEATYANGDKERNMAYYELCAVVVGGS